MLITERFAPSFCGKGGFAPILRLSGFIGVFAGAIFIWQRSSCTTDNHNIPVDVLIREFLLTSSVLFG